MSAFAKAMTLHDQGKLAEAVPWFQEALRQEPENLNVLYRAVLTLVAMRDYEGCASWLTELLPHVDAGATEPWLMSGFYYNLGVAHDALGHWSDAERCYGQAIRFNRDSILPKVNLGGLCYRLGDAGMGQHWHNMALASPRDEEARATLAFVHLLRGDYLTGFREYERRWQLSQVLTQAYVPKHAKRWTGQHLDFGKKLLVVAEQGVGDVLMMLRYVPRLVEMGLKPVLLVHAGLVRLVASSFPDVPVFALNGKHPQAGWWVPMMSLPHVFKTTLETIPDAKCIVAPTDSPAFPLTDGYRVGWVAKGNPLHMGDKDRSCHDESFTQLILTTPDVAWVNLDERHLRDRYGVRDFADTASIIAQCDLIVSVDSAVAHCAGAMGKPVYLLPPAGCEWRWGLEGTASAWYPATHTLFRRRHVNDWSEVLGRVRHQLEGR